MILVLTYHKVRERTGSGGRDFYSVSPAQLSRHLELLKDRDFHCLKIEELLATTKPPDNRFILCFDDGTADHYADVCPLLQKHGGQGVFFIPTAKLNKPGYLTNAQVQELAAAGHAIGFHSHEHRRLDVLPQAEIRRQIALSQKIIADIISRTPVLFVPPGGFVNARIRAAAVELGVQVMRTMHWGYNRKLDLMALETVPVNQYTDEKKFLRLLEARNAPFLYAGKEALKRLVPLRAYELLRSLLFKFSKSD